MYEQSHRDYLRSAICIIVCLSWAVNQPRQRHYLQSPARQKCQSNRSWRTRQLLTCRRCVSVMLLVLDAKYTKELADAKAENDALRDDAAAGRRRLHIKAVCQSVREATTAWRGDNAKPPPDWQTPLNGIISPPREADHYAKTTGRNPEVY